MADFHAHFGLRIMPFTREIRVRDMFPHPQQAELAAALLRTVEQRQSGALIAPAGYGKTVQVRYLLEALPDVRYRAHYVKITGLSKRDMSREIASSLGLAPVGTYPALVRSIQEAVQERNALDSVRSLLILDDAHEMRPDVLGILKALTNFEMDSRLLLSVLLVGQPPLSRLLSRPQLVDVAQRLSWYGRMRPLSRDETASYVEHRCVLAGATTKLFDAHAMEALYEMGQGNPRATDHLARRSLEMAYTEKAQVVGSAHVLAARATLRP